MSIDEDIPSPLPLYRAQHLTDDEIQRYEEDNIEQLKQDNILKLYQSKYIKYMFSDIAPLIMSFVSKMS